MRTPAVCSQARSFLFHAIDRQPRNAESVRRVLVPSYRDDFCDDAVPPDAVYMHDQTNRHPDGFSCARVWQSNVAVNTQCASRVRACSAEFA